MRKELVQKFTPTPSNPLVRASVLAMLATVGCAAPPGASPPARSAIAGSPLAKSPAGESAGAASGPRPEPDAPVDAATRTRLIEAALEKLIAEYVFPDVARKMAAGVRARVQRHEYDAVTSSLALARLLTEHLREVSHDKHVHVDYSADPVPPDRNPNEAMDPLLQARAASFERRVNHGFERVERLDGNIGYLEIRGFFDPGRGGETAAAAMTFLADTDALIVDLRRNGGGEPAMVALVTTYLFDGEPVHLNDLHYRRSERTQQYWTLPFVAGRRFGQSKPVYVLTSSDTFSGAEEFTYNLKTLKRATVVGETTGGGANPGDEHRLAEHFSIFVPDGRAINPITKTNWEGTGVTPDVKAPAEQALSTAYVMALKQRIEKVEEPELKAKLVDILHDVVAKPPRGSK